MWSHLKTHLIITCYVTILDLLPSPKYTEVECMNLLAGLNYLPMFKDKAKIKTKTCSLTFMII